MNKDRMELPVLLRLILAAGALIAAAQAASGEEGRPAGQPAPGPQEKVAAKGLRPVRPGDRSILLDPETRKIVLTGEFSLETGEVEYALVSRGGRNDESVVTVDAKPSAIAVALILCKYNWAGGKGAAGTADGPKRDRVQIWIEYRDAEEKTVKVRIEDLVREAKTKKAMRASPWLLTPPLYEKDEETGKRVYVPDRERTVAAIYHDPSALFNSPLDPHAEDRPDRRLSQHGVQVNLPDDVLYEVDREKAPKKGAKVNVWLEPADEPGAKIEGTDATPKGKGGD